MKIMITGSEGFIGSHVTRKLEKENKILHFNITDGQDVRDYENVRKLMKGCNVVIHLAAACKGRVDSVENPDEYFSTNVLGTFNILRSAVDNKVEKVIFATTTHALTPKTPYDLSKLQAEQWLRLFNKIYGIKAYALRFYHVYGEGERRGVVSSFIKKLKDGKEIDVFGDGNQTYDFVHVDDIANIVKMFVENDYLVKDSFEIGTGRQTTINQLVKIIAKELNVKPKIKQLPPREIDLKQSFAENPFGHTKISIENGIKNFIKNI